MKIKYLLIASLISLITFFIYLSTLDKKIYYLSLGDSLAVGLTNQNENHGYASYLANYLKQKQILEIYSYEYATIGYQTTDLIKDIEDNKRLKIANKTKTIKNALVKADITTVSIGANDLISKIKFTDDYNKLYDYADEMFKDLEKLFKLIRQYCKEDIYMIGFYNPFDINDPKLTEIFIYINKESKKLCQKYNITYIETFKLFSQNKQYLPDKFNIHPSKEGYKAIFDQLIVKIDKKITK
ncbi:MAG: GDSL-type esterase/lipase family protein [Bacilli bacterium]